MKLKLILIFVAIASLSGCGTMSSSFSCNKTATDSCLSIEEVDKMTRFADDYYRPTSKFSSSNKVSSKERLATKERDETIWIAPWKDKKGLVHKEQVINKHLSA